MYNVSRDAEEIRFTIKNKIKHSYLEKFIKTPVIDMDKLTILSILMKRTTLPKDKQYTYTVTAMLVQMALDTHDHVQVTNDLEQDEAHITARQLTVLAGDYYSALYYFLLSEIDDIQMIQVLASAIKEINEYKMQLYDVAYESFATYLNITHKINTTLLTHVATYIEQTSVNNITNQLLQTQNLMQEQQAIQNGQQSNNLNNWLEYAPSSTKKSMLNSLETMIQDNMVELEVALSDPSINDSIIHSQLDWLVKPIFQKTSIAGEG